MIIIAMAAIIIITIIIKRRRPEVVGIIQVKLQSQNTLRKGKKKLGGFLLGFLGDSGQKKRHANCNCISHGRISSPPSEK